VVVIDETWGIRLRGLIARLDLRRLSREVRDGSVGIVLGIEICPGWPGPDANGISVMELCGVGALLGDLTGVYDPAEA